MRRQLAISARYLMLFAGLHGARGRKGDPRRICSRRVSHKAEETAGSRSKEVSAAERGTELVPKPNSGRHKGHSITGERTYDIISLNAPAYTLPRAYKQRDIAFPLCPRLPSSSEASPTNLLVFACASKHRFVSFSSHIDASGIAHYLAHYCSHS